MEDILASIRRILNEEEAPPASQAAAEAPAADVPLDDDVLVLDGSMMVSPGPDEMASIEPELEAEPEPEPPAVRTEPPHIEMEPVVVPTPVTVRELPAPMTELLAPEAAAAAASSVDTLMRTLSAGRASHVYAGGPTLEDMVRAELRPLLKEWLDAYLPPMVERLVRAEIERVVGRVVP